MDTLPLHPKIVHLPIALAILLPLIAAVVLVAWWRGRWPRSTWWGVVGLQLALLVSGFAARASGEDDEERVEKVVAEAAIETHEEAADAFLIGAGIALAIAIGAGVVRAAGPARAVAAAAVAATLVVTWLGYRVGAAGGALVYQHGAAAAFAAPAGAGAGAEGRPATMPRDDDDDD